MYSDRVTEVTFRQRNILQYGPKNGRTKKPLATVCRKRFGSLAKGQGSQRNAFG
jgi:hypothetical protein